MAKKTLSKTTQTTKRTRNVKPLVKGLENREEIRNEILEKFDIIPEEDKLMIFEALGVGGGTTKSKYYTCYMCGKLKQKKHFYSCTDVRCKSKISRICKECAESIVYNVDKYGVQHPLEKSRFFEVLEYLDKPYIEKLFDSAVVEAKAGNIGRDDYWKTYIVSVCRLKKYETLRWKDSDTNVITKYVDNINDDNTAAIDTNDNNSLNTIKTRSESNIDLDDTYTTNKKDVIKFVGYDPFEYYPIEEDKPLLYAQLVNFLDEESKNDGMKLAAIVQIVKKLNQAEKLNNAIDRYVNDINNMDSNQGVINKMADTSSKLMSVANSLAKDNGINTIVPIQSDLYVKIHLIAGKP